MVAVLDAERNRAQKWEEKRKEAELLLAKSKFAATEYLDEIERLRIRKRMYKAYILHHKSLDSRSFHRFGLASVGRGDTVDERVPAIVRQFQFRPANPAALTEQIEQALCPPQSRPMAQQQLLQVVRGFTPSAVEEYAAALPAICGRAEDLGCIDVVAELLERLAAVPLSVMGRVSMLYSIRYYYRLIKCAHLKFVH
jgi:hypothetical protein